MQICLPFLIFFTIQVCLLCVHNREYGTLNPWYILTLSMFTISLVIIVASFTIACSQIVFPMQALR